MWMEMLLPVKQNRPRDGKHTSRPSSTRKHQEIKQKFQKAKRTWRSIQTHHLLKKWEKTEIFEGIWETEETPGDWKMGLIVKLPKKGDLSLCKNWRGVTLLSITSKVFSRVILDRISEALDPLLRKEQAGFRKGKSCGDHIFTLRQILEQCQEWNTPFYANFVDFEKAFDSIHRESLWRILWHYGIPPRLWA